MSMLLNREMLVSRGLFEKLRESAASSSKTVVVPLCNMFMYSSGVMSCYDNNQFRT